MDGRELRCEEGVLHGIVLPGGLIEVKCHSRFCGHAKGVVVLHRFNPATGEVTTRRFRDPANEKKEEV